MNGTGRRFTWMLLGTLCALAALTGCKASVHFGTSEVSKSEIESQVAKQLAAQVNQPEPKVTCPTGLKAKVGSSIDCDLVAQGDTDVYAVHVVVDTVNGGKVHFNATVADTPNGSGSTTEP